MHSIRGQSPKIESHGSSGVNSRSGARASGGQRARWTSRRAPASPRRAARAINIPDVSWTPLVAVGSAQRASLRAPVLVVLLVCFVRVRLGALEGIPAPRTARRHVQIALRVRMRSACRAAACASAHCARQVANQTFLLLTLQLTVSPTSCRVLCVCVAGAAARGRRRRRRLHAAA